MSFLHPLMLIAGAAVGLPVLIHWLTKPRPVRLALSTVRFVMRAVEQKRARHRLRDALILALRTAAVALIVWAFARPLLGEKPLVLPGGAGEAVRVVVVDASASMGAVSGGVSAFEKARPVAAQYLQSGGGMRVNLVLAGAAPRAVFDAPASNVGALKEELGKAPVRPERLSAQAAINLASEMLSKSTPGQRREVVIISDFQRSNWTGVDFGPLPKDAKIELKTVVQGERPNLGILRVGAQGRAEQGRDLRIEVEVGNYSAAGRQVDVDLALGRGTYRLSGFCPPGISTTLFTTITPAEAGWQVGEAKLANVEDALKADDRRAVVLKVNPSPTYVLLTRETEAPRAVSSHYVERALAPAGGPESRATGVSRVVRVSPAQFDRDSASGDLVVIDHPGKLSQQAVNLLVGMMRRGRSVLYIAAEPTDATNLKMIAQSAEGHLRMPVEFVPPRAGEVRRGLFLAEMRREQAPFAVFGESLAAGAGTLRFAGGLSSRRIEGGLADDVLASFSDRSAAIVVTPCGVGALGVINADLSTSTLPASGMFVPLLSELAARLMGGATEQTAVHSGEPMALYLPAEMATAADLAIEPREGTGSLVEEKSAVIWRWPAAGEPGIYSVKRGAATVFAVASGIAKEESDLRVADAAVMGRLAQGREMRFSAATAGGQESQDRAWAWALVACCACMIAELGVLKAYRT